MKNKFTLVEKLYAAAIFGVIVFWCVALYVAAHFVIKHW